MYGFFSTNPAHNQTISYDPEPEIATWTPLDRELSHLTASYISPQTDLYKIQLHDDPEPEIYACTFLPRELSHLTSAYLLPESKEHTVHIHLEGYYDIMNDHEPKYIGIGFSSTEISGFWHYPQSKIFNSSFIMISRFPNPPSSVFIESSKPIVICRVLCLVL